ncbi:hypothetical protein LINGRAHAP2_LOCUS14636 [Linum grandiflorum]
MKLDGMEMIKVDSPGVEDRVSFLKCCLVFRFEKVTVMNWVDFRTWASRSWGVPVDSKILHIGDDVWMLVCDSEAEVERILLLNRCKFNNIGILMDGWIKDAGRSNVCLESEVGWIMVRCIPLHLRSEELFTSIGNFCGEFICYNEGRNLDSVRIKIQMTGVVPEEVPLCHGAEVYPIRVVLEAPTPVSAGGHLNSFARRWKNKSVGYLPRSEMDATPVTTAFVSSSSEAGPSHRVGFVESSTDLEVSTAVLGKDVRERLMKAAEMGQERAESSGASLSLTNRGCDKSGTDMGLKVVQQDNLCLIPTRKSGFPVLDLDYWVGINSLLSPRGQKMDGFSKISRAMNSVEGFKVWNEVGFCCLSLAYKLTWALSPSIDNIGSNGSKDLSVRPSSTSNVRVTSEVAILDSFSMPIENDVDCGEQLYTVSGVPVEHSSANDHQSKLAELEDELLVEAVTKVSDIIDLKINGSAIEGVAEALKVCKEVGRRRKASGLSKTERELRRLGATPDGLGNSPVSARRDRYSLPYSLNEF